jgi:hypothetical protein
MTDTHRMTRRLVGLVLWLPAALSAAPGLSGRWEGEAQIPGAPLAVVIDLAPDPRSGWVGSVILPGRGIKGAPLADLQVSDNALHFTTAAAFSTPSEPTPRVALHRQVDGSLVGEWQQAGHRGGVGVSPKRDQQR